MGKAAKILETAKNGGSVSFADLQYLTEAAGYSLKRIRGDHHVYSRPNTPEIINLQPAGNSAKRYQVKQVLDLIDRYGIEIE